jgi:hypothetical protein
MNILIVSNFSFFCLFPGAHFFSTFYIPLAPSTAIFQIAIPTLYALNPLPPLITNPSICGQLSVTALKRNLEEHAKVNKDIVVGGTRPEMVERLEGLLRRREGDMIVREMVWGDEDDD